MVSDILVFCGVFLAAGLLLLVSTLLQWPWNITVPDGFKPEKI